MHICSGCDWFSFFFFGFAFCFCFCFYFHFYFVFFFARYFFLWFFSCFRTFFSRTRNHKSLLWFACRALFTKCICGMSSHAHPQSGTGRVGMGWVVAGTTPCAVIKSRTLQVELTFPLASSLPISLSLSLSSRLSRCIIADLSGSLVDPSGHSRSRFLGANAGE